MSAHLDDLLRVLDASDPANPIELSTANIPEAPRDLDVEGDYAYVAAGEAGLRIIDVSDPADARNISSFTGYVRRLDVMGDLAFIGELSGIHSDSRHILVLDVSDPVHPVEVGRYRMDDDVNAVFATEDYVYVAEDHRGLTIFGRN